MDNLLKFLSRLLPSNRAQMPESPKSRRDRLARQVVARNAEGSVRLSQGRYRTTEQVDADYKSICNTTF